MTAKGIAPCFVVAVCPHDDPIDVTVEHIGTALDELLVTSKVDALDAGQRLMLDEAARRVAQIARELREVVA